MSSIVAKSALISVFSKEGLEPIVGKMQELGITIHSTGGTEKFIKDLGIDVVPVEEITSYPSILGGRVKTLHPKVFGGILNRRDHDSDVQQLAEFDIPQLDIVVVDLYPFEKTVASGASEQEIIEKIDIGGISLIRAGAKNYKDTLCVGTVGDYGKLLEILENGNGTTTIEQRKQFSASCFNVSSHYDAAIYNFYAGDSVDKSLKISESAVMPLRYGENPHQRGWFYGNFNDMFDKVHGKELSYNNLLDVDAAVNLMGEFDGDAPTFAIFKHNNACGIAQRDSVLEAYQDALAGDPVSAFGGILISNTEIDLATATLIHGLFCEVVMAPSFSDEALQVLKGKKNRIILKILEGTLSRKRNNKTLEVRSSLNGFLVQDSNQKTDARKDLKTATRLAPTHEQIDDMLFASKICKHTKSNTIVLVKDKQLCASGTGQTSRVDALNQAIHKAVSFKFDLKGAVMASDAFFPFPDCVEIAHNAGIKAVIQPGGSIKDALSISYCDENNIAMVFTGTRHFKH
ncbi:MAG: bifunctional phosphoribosylaminoimidazolecarboxamide formyltransferase/IMP cyclohydrolase [Nonlabens sp.]